MAEQDRYQSHFGVDPKHLPNKSTLHDKLPDKSTFRTTESFWGGHDSKHIPGSSSFSGSSGAEQDRYGSHMGLDPKHGSSLRDKLPDFDSVREKLPGRSTFNSSSGAEQDRYASHFSLDSKNLPDGSAIRDKAHDLSSAIREKMPDRSNFSKSSGAEQDRFGSHFGADTKNLQNISEKLPSGAELRSKLPDANFFKHTSGAEQDRYSSHLGIHGHSYLNTTTVGLLQSTILPSFGLHSGLSIIAYGIARYTNRVEVKDILWPTATLLNAWYSAVGSRLIDGASFSSAIGSLTYTQKLLLGGVTAWAGRLLYRIVSRSITRGKDDSRYEVAKKEPGFWDNAILKMFVPEAIVQTLVTLPFVLPFRAPYASAAASPNFSLNVELVHGAAIFLFASGMALEVSADTQLAARDKNDEGLEKEGVWSIVRHPNYLGDTLIHASFPMLLAAAGLMHPLTLLGPIANYVFLRYVGGDKENEAIQEEKYSSGSPAKHAQFQEYKRDKNSFWPKLQEFANPATWSVIAVGVGGVFAEQMLRGYFRV